MVERPPRLGEEDSGLYHLLHHQLNGHEFEQTLGDSEGQGNPACCSPWGRRVTYDLATEQQQPAESLTFHHHLGPNEEFGIRLANRPFLALRGRYGYVGTSSEHDLLQCNMDQPDCIHLLPCRQGIYHFQAQGGSFWSITSFGTFRPWGKFALNFCIELQGSNLLTVLAPNGFYMRSDRSGTLLADSEDITKECIWEF